MSHPSKVKGRVFETAVVNFLREHGFPYAERRQLTGSADCGDITGLPGVVIECKSTKEISLATAMNEAETERVNAGATLAFAFVKRRNRPVQDAYVVMTLAQFCEVMSDTDEQRGAT